MTSDLIAGALLAILTVIASATGVAGIALILVSLFFSERALREDLDTRFKLNYV